MGIPFDSIMVAKTNLVGSENPLRRQAAGVARVVSLLVCLVMALACCKVEAGKATDSSGEAAPPRLRIVFFTPSDLSIPVGARERVTQVADAMEKFYFDGMKKWGYAPAVTNLFRHESDGLVEMLPVRGDQPVGSHKYDNPSYANAVIAQTKKQYHISEKGDVWWIFIYLGDPPARFEDFRGMGNARDGGSAMVNYDSRPGEIRSDFSFVQGFNGIFFLKSAVHELGHAFGLPHVGPDPELDLGNCLMGPTTAAYIRRNGAKPDAVYLSQSSAARLWKHPLFSGIARNRAVLPQVKMTDYKADYDAAKDRVTISGRLISDQPAHSVIVTDDLGKPRDQYWVRGYTSRLAADGTFQVVIDKPVRIAGHYRIEFCFNNGIVTGDGNHIGIDDRGSIKKAYQFIDGKFDFTDE